MTNLVADDAGELLVWTPTKEYTDDYVCDDEVREANAEEVEAFLTSLEKVKLGTLLERFGKFIPDSE